MLVCPACRVSAPAAPLTEAPGGWSCTRCAAWYPTLVAPMIAHPLPPFVRAVAEAFGPDEGSARALVPWLGDDHPVARRLQRVSVAARAHYGDRLEAPEPASWQIFERWLERLPPGPAVELGCGAGRVSLELARRGHEVVALDTDPAVLALGETIRARGRCDTSLRVIGATYEERRIEAPELEGLPVRFVLADALNPPLEAGSFRSVVALNLLDNVPVPSTLLGQIDALLAPGGLALISTPYSWESTHVEDGERIGGAPGRPFGGDPVGELRGIVTGSTLRAPWRFEIVAEDSRQAWTLVRDERCRFTYDLHVMLLRKPG